MSATQPLWDLAGHVARARHPRAPALLDLWAPWRGLRLEAWDGAPLPGCELLGVEFDGQDLIGRDPSAAPDCYVRGGDLVATYPATAERPSRVQAYWRLHAAADRLLLDLQVSVQTHLLDARPVVRLVSRTPRATVSQFEAVLLAGPGWQYCEMLHPDDQGQLAVGLDAGVTLTHALFDEQLEKGVILRARARGVLTSPSADAARAAAEAYREFLSEPLPLST